MLKIFHQFFLNCEAIQSISCVYIYFYTAELVFLAKDTVLTKMGHMLTPHRKGCSPNISVASLAFSKSILMALKIKRYSKDRRVSKQWPISSCHSHLWRGLTHCAVKTHSCNRPYNFSLQIPLSRESMKYCWVATPFCGTSVYTRTAMGIPGLEKILQELKCRVILEESVITKLAVVESHLKLFYIIGQVLQALLKCGQTCRHLKVSLQSPQPFFTRHWKVAKYVLVKTRVSLLTVVLVRWESLSRQILCKPKGIEIFIHLKRKFR